MEGNNLKQNKNLTPKQEYQIQQVLASLAISNMYPSQESIEELERIATGLITVEESIRKIIEEYKEDA